MLISLWLTLSHAGCADGVCPPNPHAAEVEMPAVATAPIPAIDRSRPDDIRTVVFALG